MTTRESVFFSDGFWWPSSMTMAWTPSLTIALAPARRSFEIQASPLPASISGSSPTSFAACFAGSTLSGPFSRSAIAAREAGGAEALVDEMLANGGGKRRLARAAHGEIADADDGNADIDRSCAPRRRLPAQAIGKRCRRQKQLGHRRGGARAFVGDAPEMRLTHAASFPRCLSAAAWRGWRPGSVRRSRAEAKRAPR